MKLRKWVKELLVVLMMGVVLFGVLMIYAKQSEDIENGKITVISESQMAERN